MILLAGAHRGEIPSQMCKKIDLTFDLMLSDRFSMIFPMGHETKMQCASLRTGKWKIDSDFL